MLERGKGTCSSAHPQPQHATSRCNPSMLQQMQKDFGGFEGNLRVLSQNNF